jgi:CarD family transcriptional regulator
MFKIGDRVVHPQHGVGSVVKLEEREFEPGEARQYYEVSIPGGSTLWVPLDVRTSGLRRLALKSEIAHCRKILELHPVPLDDDSRLRQSNLMARLKDGTITAHCELVRDLYAYGKHKSTYGSVAAFFQVIQQVLCQEWSIVEGISPAEAAAEIEMHLEKSKLTLKAANG